jgi:hypothetical protein
MTGMIAPVQRRSTQNSRNPQRNDSSVRVLRCLRLTVAIAVAGANATPALAHDLERTQVSLTFARDGSFVLDVTNDRNWLTLRLESFAAGRRDLAALGDVFLDRVVLFVDGHEVRPTSAELVAPAAPIAPGDAPILATYRLRGKVPADAHTLRWYYGLVIDPYPLALHRVDGRSMTELVHGDAWSRTLDISGQFDSPWIATPIARQLPIVIMVGVFGLALGYRVTRRSASTT